MPRRLRVEQQARRLAAARREHDDLARAPDARSCFCGVDVRDAGREPLGVGHHLARHRVGDDRELAGLERRRQHHRDAREVRVRRAAAAALAAVVARRRGRCAACVRIDRRDGTTGIFSRSQAFLIRSSCARGFGGGRKMPSGSLCRPVCAAWLVPKMPTNSSSLVVVRLDVVVGDRPVVAEAVDALAAEVVGAEAQRDAAPVVRAAAEHAAAEPAPRAVADRVGLALDVPAAEAAVVVAERLLVAAPAARRRVVVPREHRAVLGRVPHRPALEHHDVGAGLGQHLGGGAAAGARSDDADVVDLGRTNDLHDSPRILRAVVPRAGSLIWIG